MTRRSSLQAEVLASLAVVMLLATFVLAAVLGLHGEARLRDLLGRALLAEARGPRPLGHALLPGTEWWRVAPDGAALPHGALSGAVDAETRALAAEVRETGRPLLRPGAPWDPIRFAAPGEGGAVVAARVPARVSAQLRAAPLLVAGLVLAADVAIFTAFGAYLLRRRVVGPLGRLADAARAIAAGELGARATVAGTRETADVAVAFNAMTEALAGRTQALEQAVVELRDTNRKLREARAGLDRAERLAAVGRLAAGVAHEVGNPIGALLGFLDLIGRDPNLGETSRGVLARASREGERVRRILRQILDFSRPPRPVPVPIDLAAVAEETVALVSAQRAHREIAFELDRDPDLGRALGDPGVVAQILLNLLLNAADAVHGRPDARISIRVGPAALAVRRGEGRGDPLARRQWDAVECVVADNGPGVPEEDAERIFDPFFTTKPTGEGTGLGLSNALRLAEEQGGTVELLASGQGAAFVLRLPAAVAEPGKERKELEDEPEESCDVRSRVRSSRRPGRAARGGNP